MVHGILAIPTVAMVDLDLASDLEALDLEDLVVTAGLEAMVTEVMITMMTMVTMTTLITMIMMITEAMMTMEATETTKSARKDPCLAPASLLFPTLANISILPTSTINMDMDTLLIMAVMEAMG